MVRLTLPNRLKSYGVNSASNSRSSSPNPGVKGSNTTESTGDSAKANGLSLKVGVLKVSSGGRFRTAEILMPGVFRLGISRRRTKAVPLIQ
jgi:hypothetical protein